jgi:hypothetical protein
VIEEAEDKRWTLESERPGKPVRSTERWEHFKIGLKCVEVRLPDKRSREAKTWFLQLAGDSAGAKSVEGGWQKKNRSEARPAWEERQVGTRAVEAFWKAQKENRVPALLQERGESFSYEKGFW